MITLPGISFHKYWRTRFLLITALLTSWIVAAASPIKLKCPPSIPISAPKPHDTPTEWKVYVASQLYLNSAAPISGPPEMHGDLAEFTTKPGKIEWSYTYDLDRNFPNGKWLECGYGTYKRRPQST